MVDIQDDGPVRESLTRDDDELSRCLFAAERKIRVACYHFDELSDRLDQPSKSQDLPPIPVQAHFEGVVVSIIAAEEKVKEAVRIAYGVRRKDEQKCRLLYKDVGRKLPKLGEWYANAFLGDIREVRNLAIHQYYEKRPITAGGPVPGWEVIRRKRQSTQGRAS
jgi:hypothetical protein